MKKLFFSFLCIFIILCSCSKDEDIELNDLNCGISYIENNINNFHYFDVSYNDEYLELYITNYDDYYFNSKSSNYINKIKNSLSDNLNLNLYYDGYTTSQTLLNITTNNKHKINYCHRFKGSLYGDDIIVFTCPNNNYGFILIRVFCNNNHKHPIKKLK